MQKFLQPTTAPSSSDSSAFAEVLHPHPTWFPVLLLCHHHSDLLLLLPAGGVSLPRSWLASSWTTDSVTTALQGTPKSQFLHLPDSACFVAGYFLLTNGLVLPFLPILVHFPGGSTWTFPRGVSEALFPAPAVSNNSCKHKQRGWFLSFTSGPQAVFPLCRDLAEPLKSPFYSGQAVLFWILIQSHYQQIPPGPQSFLPQILPWSYRLSTHILWCCRLGLSCPMVSWAPVKQENCFWAIIPQAYLHPSWESVAFSLLKSLALGFLLLLCCCFGSYVNSLGFGGWKREGARQVLQTSGFNAFFLTAECWLICFPLSSLRLVISALNALCACSSSLFT